MADIYKAAENVLIWLGEETKHTQLEFGSVPKMSAEYKLSLKEENACLSTFTGGWWTRLWMLQEAYHARRLVVRCGRLEID
jgi:hypothetical protein